MASNVYKEIKYNKKILLLNFAKVKVVAQQTRISKTATETSREAINQKFKVKHELKSVTIINVTTPFNTLDYAEGIQQVIFSTYRGFIPKIAIFT